MNIAAGKSMESAAEAVKDTPGQGGTLVIKGIRAIWRQSAPIVAHVLQVWLSTLW